jgi:hypothetical protein
MQMAPRPECASLLLKAVRLGGRDETQDDTTVTAIRLVETGDLATDVSLVGSHCGRQSKSSYPRT